MGAETIPGLAVPRPNAPDHYPGDREWSRTVRTIDGWDVDVEVDPAAAPSFGDATAVITSCAERSVQWPGKPVIWPERQVVFHYTDLPRMTIDEYLVRTKAPVVVEMAEESPAEIQRQIDELLHFLDGPKVETPIWLSILMLLAVGAALVYGTLLGVDLLWKHAP